MAKLIDMTTHMWPQSDSDDTSFMLDCIINVVAQALPENRDVMLEGVTIGQHDVILEHDPENEDGSQGFVFYIFEREEKETLEQARQTVRETMRDNLRDQFGKSGIKPTLLEWTEKQVNDFTTCIIDTLQEDGQEHTEEICFLEFWRGEPMSLEDVLDQVSYPTKEVGSIGREWKKLTSEQKVKVKDKFIP